MLCTAAIAAGFVAAMLLWVPLAQKDKVRNKQRVWPGVRRGCGWVSFSGGFLLNTPGKEREGGGRKEERGYALREEDTVNELTLKTNTKVTRSLQYNIRAH